MNIEISEQNYKRLVEIKEKTEAESLDEVIDWLIDFWLSWSEKGEEIPK